MSRRSETPRTVELPAEVCLAGLHGDGRVAGGPSAGCPGGWKRARRPTLIEPLGHVPRQSGGLETTCDICGPSVTGGDPLVTGGDPSEGDWR